MKRHSLALAALATGLMLGLSAPAFAAGEETDETSPPPKTETTTKCTDGKVWDKKKECVKADQSGFNDDDLYKAAREFAYAEQYGNAIHVLELAQNQNDPRILNYLG